MKSTGEVMGIDADFGHARSPSRRPPRTASLPTSGRVFVSVANRDKRAHDLPGQAAGRPGLRDPRHRRAPAEVLRRHGVACEIVRKHSSGPGPDGEPTIVR